MLARLAHLLVFAAVLGVTGTHWVVLQSVAWSAMLANNLRELSLAEAVTRTFDGKHPCGLCSQIAAGKQVEKKSTRAMPKAKFEFVTGPSLPALGSPWLADLRLSSLRSPEPTSGKPPLPPPRFVIS